MEKTIGNKKINCCNPYITLKWDSGEKIIQNKIFENTPITTITTGKLLSLYEINFIGIVMDGNK